MERVKFGFTSGVSKHLGAIFSAVMPLVFVATVPAYATKAGTNGERLSLRAEIEQLASTNSLVAAEIHRKVE